ncbi:MAG: glycosyltransferase family protein [Ferruginibacter sp.]
MIVDNINKIPLRPRVLVAPLDWGLGHATRCITIINVLIEHNIEVIIAAEGPIAKLLQKEFPAIVILRLKGYKINYSRRKEIFFLNMLAQFPKIISAIKNEKKWLKETVERYKIDAVISDNRFGLHLAKTPCVYVTHQLFIQTGNRFLNKIVQKIHYRFINKFNECWVPDAEGINNLAGKLSHPGNLPVRPVKYLGILSRCKKIITEKKYDLLILLSGPEPQRSIFENMLLAQLNNAEGLIVLVRGLPGGAEKKLYAENKNLVIHDHLPAEALNELIQQSVNIIARCGYSTIMDLVTLQQNAILVPTPGQTEQEYLAAYLTGKKMFFTCAQENFSLEQALEAARTFNFTSTTSIPGLQKEIITDWIGTFTKQVTALQ